MALSVTFPATLSVTWDFSQTEISVVKRTDEAARAELPTYLSSHTLAPISPTSAHQPHLVIKRHVHNPLGLRPAIDSQFLGRGMEEG